MSEKDTLKNPTIQNPKCQIEKLIFLLQNAINIFYNKLYFDYWNLSYAQALRTGILDPFKISLIRVHFTSKDDKS